MMMCRFSPVLAVLVVALTAGQARSQVVPAPTPDGARKVRVVDRVVAAVNDTVILHSELMQRVAPLSLEIARLSDPAERKRRKDKLKAQVLQEMIDEELVLQAAMESKIEVTPKEIDNAVKELQRQNNLNEEQFAQALKAQGETLASLQNDLRRQFMRMRAVQMLVRPKVNVSDEEVKARWQAQSGQTNTVSRIHLFHILVRVGSTPDEAQIDAAKAKITELLDKARGGTPFTDLAKQHSDDNSTKALGGDLGWIERGSIPTEWENVVFAMDKGDVRGPIAGPQGLHLFYVSEVERGNQQPFETAKEQIKNTMFREETEKQSRLWLEELRKKAHIQNKL